MAFGPFTGRELVFAGDGIPTGALQVVYGPNEAGKSTALRAVSGLLFGIAPQTTDAFHHTMADLRLGGVLESSDGRVLEIVRRKGRRNTLLDGDGNPMDDGSLRRLCGAATEATFRALFGLDHVSLREGAEALLAGQGDVGESLFEAALGGGGRGIHRVLQELEAEADALFTPKAHKRKLNDAINAYQEARAAVRLKARSGEAWLKQRRGLEEAKADHQRLADLLRARKRELNRLERARRLLPLGARRDRLLQRLEALGPVTLLPAEATPARQSALVERQQAAAELARLDAEIAEITARRDSLSPPAWLDDPAVARLAELPDRLGAHRKAAEDRPRLVGALATCQAQAEALGAEVRGAGPGAGPVSSQVGGLGVAERARVRGLAHQEAALIQRRRQAAGAFEEMERRHRARAEQLAEWPASADSAALRRLLRRVEREGDLEGRSRSAAFERQRLRAELNQRLAALESEPGRDGESGGRGDRWLTLVAPPFESVDKFAAELQALEAREERLAEDRTNLQRRARAVQRKLTDLARGGDVPSALTLAHARAARAEAWRHLRAVGDRAGGEGGGLAVADGSGHGPAAAWVERAAAFEDAIGRADDAADRLLREADRVATASALAQEREEVERLIADADIQGADLGRRRAATAVWWNALWAGVGVQPRGADEMRAWLRQFSEACEVARRWESTAAEALKLDEQVQRACVELRAALAGDPGDRAGEGIPTGAAAEDDDLGALCEEAAAVAQAREDAAAQRAACARELTTLVDDLSRARRVRDDAEAAWAAWSVEWAAAIAPLGLAGTASAGEAEAVLEVAAALARKQDEIGEVRRRLQSIDRDAQQFDEAVRALVAALAPDLAARAPEEAAVLLLDRHREGLQARRARDGVDDDLRRRLHAKRSAAAVLAQAQSRLEALMRAAQSADLPALEEAERRSTEALELRRHLQDTEDQILAGADGLSLEAALQEIPHGPDASGTIEDLDERIDRLRDDIETLDGDTQRANRSIGSASAGLQVLEDAGGADAAAAADEAQGHLARVRSVTEDYLRLRLGARLLAREIERYREQHQGPVLLRAGALLARLTLGRYTGLRADFDDGDRPVLRCLRGDGTKVSVQGLSDGTRDQLYLALRLATLERQAATAEPLPLILDDILIHFDDARAGAALGVLAEHAQATQVVLFTHHARIVDLARRMLPVDSLRVSHLEG